MYGRGPVLKSRSPSPEPMDAADAVDALMGSPLLDDAIPESPMIPAKEIHTPAKDVGSNGRTPGTSPNPDPEVTKAVSQATSRMDTSEVAQQMPSKKDTVSAKTATQVQEATPVVPAANDASSMQPGRLVPIALDFRNPGDGPRRRGAQTKPLAISFCLFCGDKLIVMNQPYCHACGSFLAPPSADQEQPPAASPMAL